MSNFDDELTRTLHRHADDLSATPLAFDDVRGRATSIRRRRRLATGLGVAAAVAVIVPTAIFATKGTNADGPTPAEQTPTVVDTNTPSPTPTSTPVMGSDPHALDVRDLPTGAPPAIGYLTKADRTPFPYAYAVTGEVTVYADADGVSVEGDGQAWGYSGASALARNAAGTAVAWVMEDGLVMAWQDGSTEPEVLAGVGLLGGQTEAVTGDGCRHGKAVEGDCAVFVRGSNGNGEPESLKLAGGVVGVVDPGGRVIQVRDADEAGRVLGTTEIGIDSSCSEALDGRQTLMQTCDYQLDEFSPDGSYILASEGYHDGAASGVVAVIATDGHRLSWRGMTSPDMAGYQQAVWEDDTHILFTAYQDGLWSIVRMDVHGAMEYAVPPTQGGDIVDPPFVLETR